MFSIGKTDEGNQVGFVEHRRRWQLDRRILIVDDDEQMWQALVRVLESWGYECMVADNGCHAVNLVTNEAPDLLITDLSMFGMDGYELCRSVREVSLVPIIMLTSEFVDGKVMVDAAAAGASLVMNKVDIVPDLLTEIKNLLGD